MKIAYENKNIDSHDELQIRPEWREERGYLPDGKGASDRDDEAGLIDRLRDSCGFVMELSLAAVSMGMIIGHILFTSLI